MEPIRMRNKTQRAIVRWLRGHSLIWISYSRWYVGITNNPDRRKRQHEERLKRPVKAWATWNVGRLKSARDLEVHFGANGLGMKGGDRLGNVMNNTTWIYVFR